MIKFGALVLIASIFVPSISVGESWEKALGAMPVPASALPLSRENFISTCVTNFQSNAVVKGLIFLPGVSDDFYLINRGKKEFTIRADNLLEALCRLTNSTELVITFKEPFLLVHTRKDRLDPAIVIKHPATATALIQGRSIPGIVCSDAHWDAVQPVLQKSLHLSVRPIAKSSKDWHFNRHNLAVYGTSDLDLVLAFSLTAGTTPIVEKKRLTFEVRPP